MTDEATEQRIKKVLAEKEIVFEEDPYEEQYKRFQERRPRMGEKRQALLDELIKDKPDQKLLESFALERIAFMQEFMRDLSSEQKQKFVEIINKRFSLSPKTSTGPPAE